MRGLYVFYVGFVTVWSIADEERVFELQGRTGLAHALVLTCILSLNNLCCRSQ